MGFKVVMTTYILHQMTHKILKIKSDKARTIKVKQLKREIAAKNTEVPETILKVLDAICTTDGYRNYGKWIQKVRNDVDSDSD